MARVIVITSGKGGVGKTTTTSNLGMALARLGYKTLLIDADVGLRNLDLLLGLENRVIYTGFDVLNKTCRLEQALIQDKRQPKLTFFPLCSSQSKAAFTKEQIQELIDLVIDKYDFILIDSPAGIDDGFQTAIAPAQEALIVVTPEVPSIRDADKVIGILISRGVKTNQLIVNRIRPKMIKSDEMMSITDIQNILGIPILGTIPDSEQVIIASNRGEPLVLDDKLSFPGIAFENAAQRLEGQDVELLDLNRYSKNPVKTIIGSFLNRKNQSNKSDKEV
jgi:septum site-determining protein MinD